jgi:hypothetical protein
VKLGLTREQIEKLQSGANFDELELTDNQWGLLTTVLGGFDLKDDAAFLRKMVLRGELGNKSPLL